MFRDTVRFNRGERGLRELPAALRTIRSADSHFEIQKTEKIQRNAPTPIDLLPIPGRCWYDAAD